VVTTAVPHGFSNGQFVNISAVLGMTEINIDSTEAYPIAGVTSNSFQLVGMDSTEFGVYTGGGTTAQVTNEVTGMTYLMGQQVVAVGDGAIILPVSPVTTVTSDTVTFAYYANFITIGIPYQMTVRPTNPTLSSQAATTRGMKQKLDRVTLSLYQAMGGNVGVDLDHIYPINYGPGSQGQQPAMSSFEFTQDLDCDWTDQSTIYIIQGDPLPFTLRGLVMRLDANQD
jgi:hypothetical protein